MSMTSFLIRRISRENDELRQEKVQHINISNEIECKELLEHYNNEKSIQIIPFECRQYLEQNETKQFSLRRRQTRAVKDDFDSVH